MKIEISKEDVLKAVEALAPATVSDIAKSIKVNQMYVSGFLSALEELDLVKSKSAGSSTVYTLNGDGK